MIRPTRQALPSAYDYSSCSAAATTVIIRRQAMMIANNGSSGETTKWHDYSISA